MAAETVEGAMEKQSRIKPFRAPKEFCVWVLEVAVLSAAKRWGKDEIAWWEVWSAHNTRHEAVAERDKEHNRPKWITKKFHKATHRIRKYVPEIEVQRDRG